MTDADRAALRERILEMQQQDLYHQSLADNRDSRGYHERTGRFTAFNDVLALLDAETGTGIEAQRTERTAIW